MICTPSLRTFVRYAFGLVALAFVAATCRDLTSPTGVATEGGPVTVVYRGPTDTNGVVQLTVGDKISPPVEIRIGGTIVSRARFVFSNMDTSVLKTSANGDSLFAVARGRDTVVVSLVGATIGGKIDPGSILKDTVLVAVKPARNLVTTNPIPMLRALGDTAFVSAESRDINNVRTKAGKVRWYSANPAIFAVDSVGTANADGTNTSGVVAVGNGTADLTTIFDDVETVRTPVTVQQTVAKYVLRSRFGGGALGAPIDFTSLGDTATLQAVPVDAKGRPLSAGAVPPPTAVFAVSPPGRVAVNAVSGLVTANFNTDLGAPVMATATGGAGTGTITSDPLPIVVQQMATSIAIIGKRVDTIPSIGSTKDLSAIVKDARGNDVQTGITWISRNTAVAQFRTSSAGDAALAIDTGTTRFVVSRDQVADSITVTVTNDPATVTLLPDTVFIRSLDEIKRFASVTVRNAKGDPLLNIPLTWTSADPAIVQANADSSLVGRGVGATNVTAQTPNGRIATSRVVVTNAPAFLDILPANSTLASVGDVLLNIGVDFRNGLGVTLPRSSASWGSSDVNVATVSVDPAGDVRIIAVGTGNAYVRAVSPVDPLVRDSVFVTVTNAPATIVAGPNPAPTLTAFGATVTFTATVFNASGNPIPTANIVWSVPSGGGFVSIDPVTGVATALANGSATLRATSGMIAMDIPLTVAQAIAGTRSTISAGAASLVANGTSSTSITVQLRDANDNPIAFGGSTIVLTTSLGTLGSTTPTDDGNGQYTTTLTAGTQSGSASVTGTVNGNAITNNAIVAFTPGGATKYLVTSTDLTPVAGTPVTVRAQLADANNNPIAGAGTVVQFSSTNGGSFTPVSGQATTDGAGVATITFTTNTTASSHTITASSGGISGSSAAILSVAGAAARYLVTPSTSSPVAGSVITVSAQLADVNNNFVAQLGQTVTWSHAGAGSFPAGTSSNTNASGVATISFTTAASAGQAATVTATTGGITGTTASFTTIAGTASQLAIVQAPSANPQSGVEFLQQPAIQLLDAQGNPVTALNVSVTASITAGGGTLGGATTVQTDANGLATFTNLSISGLVGARTLTFIASGLASATTAVTLTAGNAAQLAIATAPSANPQNAVQFATQPALQLRDAAGNVVTAGGVVVTASITSGGGSLSGPVGGISATTAVGTGMATFQDLTITGTIGARTITFTAPTLTGAAANVTLSPGAVDHFLVEAAGGGVIPTQFAGTSFNIRVVAQDMSDNIATSFSGAGNTVDISSPNSATFSAGSGVTPPFTNGVLASRAVTITNGGTFSVAATKTADTETGTSNLFQVLLAAQYTVTAAPSVQSGSSVIVSAQLADAGGTPVATAGKTVSWTKTGPGGTFATPTSLTDANGVAQIAFTGTVAGVHTVTATDNTLLTGTSGVITVDPGPATHLELVTQPSATATAGTAFAQQPVIEIRDAFDNVVTSDNSTSLTATRGGGTGPLIGISTRTAVNGVVAYTGLRYDQAETITLDFSSTPALTTVSSNAIAVSANVLDHFDILAIGSPQTAGVAFPITFTARDVFGNTVTSFSGAGSTVDVSGVGETVVQGQPLVSAPFSNGVLNALITITTTGPSQIQIVRTGGTEAGMSNTFTVNP